MAESSDDKKDDQKKTDKTSGFASSFDQYEYVAVITPGATLLLGLMMIFPSHLPANTDTEIGLGTLGLFLVAAYVAGHIVRAIGDVAERIFWRCIGGMPSEWVLRADLADRDNLPGWLKCLANATTLLNPQQKADLIARVQKLFKIRFDDLVVTPDDDCASRAKKFEEWQSVTRQINTTVNDAKKGDRVNAFNRTYGMMVGVTVAIVIIAVTIWTQGWVLGTLWRKPAVLGAIAFIVALFTAYRAFIFGKLYARELFVSFLNVTKPK